MLVDECGVGSSVYLFPTFSSIPLHKFQSVDDREGPRTARRLGDAWWGRKRKDVWIGPMRSMFPKGPQKRTREKKQNPCPKTEDAFFQRAPSLSSWNCNLLTSPHTLQFF